jgi:acetyl-CoA acetyltransferase
VTAGNSSPLYDGGTALLLASREYAGEHGVTPNAHIRSMAVAAVPPRITGIGPVPAGRNALERDGLTVADMGLNELNEAFAAQTLAALQEWGTGPEAPWANVNGGAIASGHRVVCSGSRLRAPSSTRWPGERRSLGWRRCALWWARESLWWSSSPTESADIIISQRGVDSRHSWLGPAAAALVARPSGRSKE